MIKILLVDDDKDLRLMLSVLLSHFETKISEASSGEEALSILQKNDFDLVISDIEMRNGDGHWLLDQIKTLNTRPRVIIVSGKIDACEMKLKRAGAEAFFPKPIDFQFLQDYIFHSELSNF